MTIANTENRTDPSVDGELSGGSIETVAFLARSEHRLRVLSLLDGGVRTRDELREEVGATRVTLSRILGDLGERELIARRPSSDAYELTRFGELVYRDFTGLLDTVSVGRAYPDVVNRLPTDWFDFDLGCLAEGELVGDDEADPMGAARAVANAVQEASSRDALLGTFLSTPLYTFEEALRDGDEPTGAVVFDAAVAERMLEDPDLLARWRKIETMTDAPVYYRVADRVPCGIGLMDGETVFLTIEGEGRRNFDVIRCTHPEVVAWADRTIAEYRSEATPLRQYADGPD